MTKLLAIPTGKMLNPTTGKRLGITPWTPAQITTEAWFDASDTATITESAGSVSQLADKSGNGNDITQGVGSKQPTTGFSINGRNAVDFDGATPFKILENGVQKSYSALTIVAVFDQDGILISRAFGIRDDDGGSDEETFSMASDNSLRFDGGFQAGSIPPTVGEHLRVSYRSNSLVTDYIDGLENINTADVLPDIKGRINMGQAEWSLTGGAFDGRIGECIAIVGAVDEATRQKIEGYLAWKWGLVANLPIGHPYKFNPPTV